MPNIVERIMAQRGIGDIEEFNRPKMSIIPNPSNMKNFDKGVARVSQSILNGHPIYIYGDFDADGVTSSAIMTGILEQLGAQISVSVASRAMGYGYHYSPDSKYTKGSVLLILDCGTNDFSGISDATRHCGVDVIVVDHHKISIPEFPGYALINPQQDPSFPSTLCTAGLAFCFAHAVARSVNPSLDTRQYLDLVAVGSIADMVQIDDVNRELIRAGLREINKWDVKTRPGLYSLLKVAKHRGQVTSTTLGWTVGPRLNACGRLGDARPALDMLLEKDEYKSLLAAANVEKFNKDRRKLQDTYIAEAEEQVCQESVTADRCIVAANPSWIPGLVGIVAGRLCDKYQVPVLSLGGVEGEDVLRGSGRAPDGIDLYAALKSTEKALKGSDNPLEKFGGHKGAAGLTLKAVGLEAFIDSFKSYCREHCPDAPGLRIPVPDIWVEVNDIDMEAAESVIACGPYGRSFPVPVLGIKGAVVSIVRKFKDGEHMEIFLYCRQDVEVRAVWFGCGDVDLDKDDIIDIVFNLEIGHDWRTGAPHPLLKVLHMEVV